MCQIFDIFSLILSYGTNIQNISEMIFFGDFLFIFRIYLSFYLHCMVPPIMLRCRNLQPFFSVLILFSVYLFVRPSTKLLVRFIDVSSLLTAVLPMCLSCYDYVCLSLSLYRIYSLSLLHCRLSTKKKFAKRAIYTTK